MAQPNPATPQRNGLRRAWDDSLNPRARALAGGLAIMAAGVLFFFAVDGQVATGGVLASFYIAVIATLILARRGYFADRVTVFLDGDAGREETRQKIRPVLKRDHVRTLDDPATMTAGEALEHYPPTARVLGIWHAGEARAYPLAVLSYRECVHDEVRGVPVVVAWAPFCYNGRAFLAPRDETPLRFGSTGRVVVNSPVMYDRETGERWLQYEGAFLDGLRTGQRLPEIPSLNTTLAAWTRAHPETTVVRDTVAPTSDLFDTYYAGGRAGVHRPPHRDPRWPPKEIVAGMSANGDACAFPMSWLQVEPLAHEEVGGVPVVVAYEEASASIAAFRSEAAGRRLEFEPEALADDAPAPGGPDAPYEPLMLRDMETGSRWHALNGACVDGQLSGERLEPVAAGLTFWFAWTNFHPSTRLPPRPDLSVLAQAPES